MYLSVKPEFDTHEDGHIWGIDATDASDSRCGDCGFALRLLRFGGRLRTGDL